MSSRLQRDIHVETKRKKLVMWRERGEIKTVAELLSSSEKRLSKANIYPTRSLSRARSTHKEKEVVLTL